MPCAGGMVADWVATYSFMANNVFRKPMKSNSLIRSLFRLLAVSTGLVVSPLPVLAQTWTNFLGSPLRWGIAGNWSPNTVPNANGATANFQVDVPATGNIALLGGTGTNGTSQTPLLTTLKLGDTNGNQGLTIWRENTTTTSRLHFTNSVGSTFIEKRGDGNDTINIGAIRTYNTNLNIVFAGGTGTLTISCDIAEQAPYVTRVTVSGPGTLALNASSASTYTGGTEVNGATVQFNGDTRFGTLPAFTDPANIILNNGGTIRANGSSVNINSTRGIFLKGGSNVTIGTLTNTQNLSVHGPISSDVANPAPLVIAGPGNIMFTGGPHTYTTPTIVSGGSFTTVPASHTGGGSLSVSNAATLILQSTNNTTLNVSSLTLGNGGDVTVNLNYGSLGGVNPSNPAINSAGALNAGAANVLINVTGSGFAVGQFTLIKYSGAALPNINNFTLASVPAGVIATLVNNTANTSIDLNITLAVPSVTWYGGVNSQWDIATTLNWNSGGSSYNEYGAAGDAVIFDDTLQSPNLNTNIAIVTAVRPALFTMSNNIYGYTFSGPGKITGATILNVNGTQPVTLGTLNDYTAGSLLNTGLVRIANNVALGSGAITFNGGGVSSDSSTGRGLTNALKFTGANGVYAVLGDAVNNGTIVLSGPVDFTGSSRDVLCNSEVVFTGSVTNGGLDQKRGAGLLRLDGVQGDMSGGQIQVEQGSVVISGGNIYKSGGGVRVVCTDASGTASLILTNGAVVTLASSGSNLRIGSASSPTSEPSATNIVHVAGTLTWTTNNTTGGQIQLGASCAFAQLNLYPGSFVRPGSIVHLGSTTEANFDGGTLAPIASTTTFMEGLTSAYIRSGGLTIDTEGKDITIGQGLLNGGLGGLTKNGAGKLTLTGANTYVGNTVVNGGTLVVGPPHAASGNIFAGAGTTIGYLSTGPGQTVTVSSTTVASGGSLQAEFTGYTSNPTAAAATVNTLILNGVTPVSLRASGLATGTIPLISYTTLTGGSVTTGQLPPGVVGTVVNNTATKTIELVVTSITPLRWTASSNSNWDINLTANWNVDGNATVFSQSDYVRFDDSAASPVVIIQHQVAPRSIVVSNSSVAYTITTSATTNKITGTTGILKQGTNSLSIGGTHDFTGNITVESGTLIANSVGAVGSTNGVTTIQSGATFDSTGQDLRNERFVVSGAGYQGKGALISSGATQNSLRYVTLVGDTTIGAVNNVQWGFHSTTTIGSTFAGNGYKVTKVGAGDVLLKDLGETSIGNIEINESALSFQSSTTLGDPSKTCTVSSNGVLALRDRTVVANKKVVLNSGMMRDTGTTASDFLGPITLNGTCQFSFTPNINLQGPIDGSGTLLKTGSGTVILSATNSYSGSTIISNGTIQVSTTGSISSCTNMFVNGGATFDVSQVTGFTLTPSQTLSGRGTVLGSVVANGTIAPGASAGTLTFNNDLTLNGTTVMEVSNDGVLTNDLVNVSGTLTYGGTLRVVFNGTTPLAVNDTFDLFNWGSRSGSFSSVILPSGYTWDTSQLEIDGTVRVTGIGAAPSFAPLTFNGSSLTLSGSGGAPGGSYRVLASTNVGAPVATWTPVATNTFDGSGNFNLNIQVTLATPQTYYLLSIP